MRRSAVWLSVVIVFTVAQPLAGHAQTPAADPGALTPPGNPTGVVVQAPAGTCWTGSYGKNATTIAVQGCGTQAFAVAVERGDVLAASFSLRAGESLTLTANCGARTETLTTIAAGSQLTVGCYVPYS